jgi:MFS family permease
VDSSDVATLGARRRFRSVSYPWQLVGLLWMVAFLNSADRSVIFAVMPQLRTEFHLTDTQLALISSVFFWIYAIAAFLSGRLSDKARRSTVVIGGLAFWSVATGIASLSTGFAMFIALRGFVALGESTYYPAATALISDWHTRGMRSRALSLHQTGVFAGAGLGGYIAGEMADRLGWRIPFVVFGGVGLVVGMVSLRFLRDRPAAPLRNPPGSAEPAAPLRDPASPADIAAAARASVTPLTLVFAQRPALALCAVFFLCNGAATGITVWAPTYVHDVMGMNLGTSALYGAASINLAGFLAVPFGGLLADWLAGRTPIGRFYALIIGLGIAAVCLVPLAVARSALMVGMVLLCSSIGKGLFDGCIYAAMHDVVPPQARATAVGLMTMLGFFGAGLMPLLVAQSATLFGMAAGLASLAVLYLIAVGILLATRGSTHIAVLETRQLEAGP